MDISIIAWLSIYMFVFVIFACRVNYKLNKILDQINIHRDEAHTIYDIVKQFDTTLYEIRKKEDKWGDYSRAFDKLFSDINKKKAESMLQNESTRTLIECFQIALWMMKEEAK